MGIPMQGYHAGPAKFFMDSGSTGIQRHFNNDGDWKQML
jgi:hypothetical protein